MEHIHTLLPELIVKATTLWHDLKAGDPATVMGTVIGGCMTLLGKK